MRLSRLPAVLVAAALLTGMVSCAATVEGTGTVAADVVTRGSTAPAPAGTPTAGAPPTSADPTPMPTPAQPSTDPVVVKRRLLCVLERAAIANVNSQFNKQKDRGAQIRVLRQGATTIRGHIRRSGLPTTDGIRQRGQRVLDQLDRLVAEANKGRSPSTQPYNRATQTFQNGCNSVP
jgi:hypothetical protein